MERATETGQSEQAEAALALPDWMAAVLSLFAVGAAALAMLAGAYWLVSRF